MRGSDSLQAGKHMEVRGEWCTGQGTDALCLFPHALPCTSLPSGCSSISFITFFYDKLANTLSSVSQHTKLLTQGELLPSVIYPVGQKHSNNLDL